MKLTEEEKQHILNRRRKAVEAGVASEKEFYLSRYGVEIPEYFDDTPDRFQRDYIYRRLPFFTKLFSDPSCVVLFGEE